MIQDVCLCLGMNGREHLNNWQGHITPGAKAAAVDSVAALQQHSLNALQTGSSHGMPQQTAAAAAIRWGYGDLQLATTW